MSSSSSPRVSAVRVVVYCAAMVAAYTVSWMTLDGVSSRGALALVSAWWAGLYVSLLLALRVEELLRAAAVVLPLMLAYHLLSRGDWEFPFSFVLVTVLIQSAFVLSPIAVNRLLGSIVRLAASSSPLLARCLAGPRQGMDEGKEPLLRQEGAQL